LDMYGHPFDMGFLVTRFGTLAVYTRFAVVTNTGPNGRNYVASLE
jgi:hypothetical protein